MTTVSTNTATLAGGLTIPYAEAGDPAGTPVVFVHGFSDSWRSFEPILVRLSSSIHAFALTLRGHGDADRPEAGYRPQDFAADTVAFMDAVGLHRAALVGHSMGASVALVVASTYSERLLGLVLISARMTLRIAALWDMVASLKDPIDRNMVERWVRSSLVRPVPDELIKTAVAESMKMPARVWKAAVRDGRGFDPATFLPGVAVPTMLMWGDQDSILRSEQDLILSVVRQARLVVYEGVGHAVHWEEPDRVAAELSVFLGNLTSD